MMPSDFTSLFVDLAGLRTMLADVESLDFDAQPRNLTSIVQTHIMISTSFTFLPFYYRVALWRLHTAETGIACLL